ALQRRPDPAGARGGPSGRDAEPAADALGLPAALDDEPEGAGADQRAGRDAWGEAAVPRGAGLGALPDPRGRLLRVARRSGEEGQATVLAAPAPGRPVRLRGDLDLGPRGRADLRDRHDRRPRARRLAAPPHARDPVARVRGALAG